MPEKFNELLLKQDIIELYNAGITPDYGYLMNGRFEKDMVKTIYPLKTLSGNPISWEAREMEYLFPNVSLQPKQAGSGDPSPENVRPISGYDSVTVNVRGKNLWTSDISYPVAQNKLNYDEDTETYTLFPGTPAWSNSIFSLPTPIPSATQVTCSVFFESGRITGSIAVGGYHYNPRSWQGEVEFPQNQDLSGKTVSYTMVTTDTVTDFWVFLHGECEVLEETKFKVMYVIGENSGNWEPYQPGTTATLILPETIYGGTVDAVRGVGSKEWFTVILTGNETWMAWDASMPNSFFTDIVGHKNLANNAINIICSNFKYDNGESRYSPYHFFSQNPGAFPDNVRLCFTFDETVTNVELAKQWIADQYTAGTPVTICYKLATPESFQATGNQQLTSLTGYNTIYTNGESIKLNRKARRLEV